MRPSRGLACECDYPPEAQQRPIVSSSGLPENLPLGEIDDAVRAATAGETPLYRLDEARIARIQPDLIFTHTIVVVAPCGYHLTEATEQARAVLAELATTPAGRNNQVWAIDADAYVVRPGPRLIDGLELLAWIIAG